MTLSTTQAPSASGSLAYSDLAIDQLVVLPQEHEKLECLIIAHNDPALIERLQSAMPPGSAAALSLPQERWDLSDPKVAEMIRRTIARMSVSQILLVAHSQAGAPKSPGAPAAHAAQAESAGVGILGRVSAWQQQVERIEDHLAQQYFWLLEICASIEEGERRQPCVDALLFRAEAHEFVAYDALRGRFSSLSTVGASR